MGKEKKEEKNKAFELFCDTDLTQKEIAAVVHTSPQQLSKWVKDGNWDIHRSARRVTTEQLILDWYQQISLINKKIKEEQEGMPTPAQVDMMNKIKDNIAGMVKKYNLSAYHSVLKECLEWLMKANSEGAKTFGPLMLEFLKEKAKKLSDDKSF